MKSAQQKFPTHNKQIPNIKKNKSLMWDRTPVSSRTAWDTVVPPPPPKRERERAREEGRKGEKRKEGKSNE